MNKSIWWPQPANFAVCGDLVKIWVNNVLTPGKVIWVGHTTILVDTEGQRMPRTVTKDSLIWVNISESSN